MGEMISNEKYEKPKMKFVALRNEETVANTCWGYHGTDTKLYWDIPGEGYLSFQIASGSCSIGEHGEGVINVQYYTDEENYSGASSEQISQLVAALMQSGGESGNPYKGEGTTVIPDHPGSSWS